MSGISRRRLLGLAGAGVAIGAGGAAGAAGLATLRPDLVDAADAGVRQGRVHAFRGTHQAGIVTPTQDHLHFASFDLTSDRRQHLIELLRVWTVARGADHHVRVRPTLFLDEEGRDRFGLAERRPQALERLPHFPADALDPARSDGDLCVQACADDPQVAVHAVRNLARLAFGTAAVRWSQLGFGRTSSTSDAQVTPRNLFGFKDGTANVTAEHPDDLEEHVWVPPAGAGSATSWRDGGSYLVARRIAMGIETWDRASLREQEALVGRTKGTGAPLSGGQEHDDVDLAATGRGDLPFVGLDAHVRLAHPISNDGVRMLRRGYNYTDGTTSLGRLDAGLFFVAYVRDPRTHYVPMQTRLSQQDGLIEYLQHTGSGLWAVPPGVGPGEHVGEALLV